MIVRMWRGKVRKDLKSEYVAYLNQTGLADYGQVERNQGVYLLCQDLGDNVEFLTMTFGHPLQPSRNSRAKITR